MFESTMMDMPLTLDILIQRALTVSSHGEVVSRKPDRSLRETHKDWQ